MVIYSLKWAQCTAATTIVWHKLSASFWFSLWSWKQWNAARLKSRLCFHCLWLWRTWKEIWACACTLLLRSLSHSYEQWVSFITLASSRLIRWESGPAPSDKCPNREKCTGVSVTDSEGRRVGFVLHSVLTELYIHSIWKCPIIFSKPFISIWLVHCPTNDVCKQLCFLASWESGCWGMKTYRIAAIVKETTGLPYFFQSGFQRFAPM